MTPAILILKDVHNDLIRINVNTILSYRPVGAYSEITLSNDKIAVVATAEEIDEMLSELYFMVKKGYHDELTE